MRRRSVHIHWFLLPLAWLYGLATWVRNKMFDWGILRSEAFPIPVISVGNIIAGGAGKTPHIEYLVRLLRPDRKVAVLSRGYKRKSKGFVLADAESTSRTIGDEPYQIRRKFPDILVAVDRKRVRGIRRLLSLEEDRRPDVVLLDDAFQHRYATPSLSILLTDINRIFYEDYLLPAGRLRESVSNKSRANMVIVTKCLSTLTPIDYRIISNRLNLHPYQRLFFTSYGYGNLKAAFDGYGLPEMSLPEVKRRKMSVLLLSGIAHPGQLTNAVAPFAVRLEKMEYPDHHDYSPADLTRLKERFDQLPGANKLIVTTEKDAARLVDNENLDERLRQALYCLPVEVRFTQNDSEEFNQKIIEHVETVERNRLLD